MSSSFGPAMDGFIALMTASLPATTQVYFGKELAIYEAPVTLQILGIQGHQDPAELSPTARREETFSILCKLTSYAGDQKFLDRFHEVMTTWALITVAVANDPHLTGTPGGTGNAQTPVRFAQPISENFMPEANTTGQSLGCLTFEVHCAARITSLT